MWTSGVPKPGRGCNIHVHFRALRDLKCPPSVFGEGVKVVDVNLESQRLDILTCRLDIFRPGLTS
jgi:hypothetical protein